MLITPKLSRNPSDADRLDLHLYNDISETSLIETHIEAVLGIYIARGYELEGIEYEPELELKPTTRDQLDSFVRTGQYKLMRDCGLRSDTGSQWNMGGGVSLMD